MAIPDVRAAAGQVLSNTRPGSLTRDFGWAMASPTLKEAQTRWTSFLKAHKPADGEYDDPTQARMVERAEAELGRAQRLLSAPIPQVPAGYVMAKEYNEAMYQPTLEKAKAAVDEFV